MTSDPNSGNRELTTYLESLMIGIPFATPINGSAVRQAASSLGFPIRDEAEISQQQLAEFWLRLYAPDWSGDKTALIGFLAYLTRLIQLTSSFLDRRLSGDVYCTLAFDWTRKCSRLGSLNGFGFDQNFDHLIDLVDRYPELEAEKGVEGMLNDESLRALALKIRNSLEKLWVEFKRSLNPET